MPLVGTEEVDFVVALDAERVGDERDVEAVEVGYLPGGTAAPVMGADTFTSWQA